MTVTNETKTQLVQAFEDDQQTEVTMYYAYTVKGFKNTQIAQGKDFNQAFENACYGKSTAYVRDIQSFQNVSEQEAYEIMSAW
jgi:pyruvate dehydrogenase complex dehydrogenase (E1) component